MTDQNAPMSEDAPSDWRTAEDRASDIAQAKALREQASQGGLRFEVYLPSSLAEWVLDFVQLGVFTDPSEAVFVILGEHQELEPHADLREEILRRSLEASMNDPRPSIPGEEAMAHIARKLAEPRPDPAVWRQRPRK
ncbi:MAG: hypothetical protein ACLP7P_02225 [Rhodomicrobium sp.]